MQNESGARVANLNLPPNKPKTWISLEKTSKMGQIHVNVNLPFKQPLVPVHEGYYGTQQEAHITF